MFILAAFLLLFGTLLVGCLIGLLASLPRILRLEKERDNFKEMAQKWANEAAEQLDARENEAAQRRDGEGQRYLEEIRANINRHYGLSPLNAEAMKGDPLDADLIGDE